jgi:hypothetical protein
MGTQPSRYDGKKRIKGPLTDEEHTPIIVQMLSARLPLLTDSSNKTLSQVTSHSKLYEYVLTTPSSPVPFDPSYKPIMERKLHVKFMVLANEARNS